MHLMTNSTFFNLCNCHKAYITAKNVLRLVYKQFSPLCLSYAETNETIVGKGGEPQSFPHLADGFRIPRLGETIGV